jgi:hypothetical protein
LQTAADTEDPSLMPVDRQCSFLMEFDLLNFKSDTVFLQRQLAEGGKKNVRVTTIRSKTKVLK